MNVVYMCQHQATIAVICVCVLCRNAAADESRTVAEAGSVFDSRTSHGRSTDGTAIGRRHS